MKLFFAIALAAFCMQTVYAASMLPAKDIQQTPLSTIQQAADFDLSSVIPAGQLFSDYRAESNSSNVLAPPRKKVWSALSPVKAFAHLDEVEQSLLERHKTDLQSLSETEQLELRLVLDNDRPVRRNDVGLLKRIGAAGLRLAYHY